jgi:D-alanyl-lipoteichoic acid acyltransferase DltB (MBOAT superfamily)
MSLDLTAIALFAAAAVLYGALAPARLRGWLLLAASLAAVFWLQPPLPIRYGAAVLPALAIGLAAGGWWLTGRPGRSRAALSAAILALVLLFVVIKSPPLATASAGWWRSLTGQHAALASPADLAWVGFSFLAFRIIHTLRDRQTGLLPELSLREYLTYALFFPAYTAGPIDRAERFAADYRALPAMPGLDPGRLAEGGGRIALGLFKKFVIADLLALGAALNPVNAAQAQGAAGLWLLLYGYAFRLYFDFAGYSDIAIGLGILFGIRLPENFDRPYLRTTITSFWQSWHITLSSWVRFYVFSPLSRWLLARRRRPSATAIVLIAQVSTMVVMGLWHGVTWNFAIWGLWHGLALFAHKAWSDRTRRWRRALAAHPVRRRAWSLAGWFVTFHYVVLGWVWFALPDTGQAADVLGRLFGGAG